MVRLDRFVLVASGVVSSAASVQNSIRQRLATRSSIVQRLILRDIVPADPAPSPVEPSCLCGDGTPCPNDCAFMCQQRPPPEDRKRSDEYDRRVRARGGFVPASDFYGSLLQPAHAALFLASEGDFEHPNGTRFRDDQFIATTRELRASAARHFPFQRIVARAGEQLVRFAGTAWLTNKFARLIATATVDSGGAPHEMVYAFSEQWGVLVGDLLPTARALLLDETKLEFNVYHHSISRQTLTMLVSSMCPKLGPQMCGGPTNVNEE